jgi:hypothetical protein
MVATSFCTTFMGDGRYVRSSITRQTADGGGRMKDGRRNAQVRQAEVERREAKKKRFVLQKLVDAQMLRTMLHPPG